MKRNCVICIKDYNGNILYNTEFVGKGALLHLDAGKIYNSNMNWICDLYSEEGAEHFVFIKNINNPNFGGVSEIAGNVLYNLVNYSRANDRYKDFEEENILESIQSCLYWLENKELPSDLNKRELILDLAWLSMILLEKEMGD